MDEKSLTSFSKASFSSNTSGTFHFRSQLFILAIAPELDISDPDFWKKLLPNAAKQKNPLIQSGTRQRKKVQRLGADLSESSSE